MFLESDVQASVQNSGEQASVRTGKHQLQSVNKSVALVELGSSVGTKGSWPVVAFAGERNVILIALISCFFATLVCLGVEPTINALTSEAFSLHLFQPAVQDDLNANLSVCSV